MSRKFLLSFLVASFVALFPFSQSARADQLTLRIADRDDSTFDFYHDLLVSAFARQGTELTLQKTKNLPQKRLVAMFEAGHLDILWLIGSKERDLKYATIPIGLTRGLVGQRILLVPKDRLNAYANVDGLEAFRALRHKAVFGENWFDVRVWEANQLDYAIIPGEWRRVYNILSSERRRIKAGYDYFSLGSLQITREAAPYPDLAKEPRLLLIYDRDFKYYVRQDNPDLHQKVMQALQGADASGLLDEKIQEYYGAELEALSLESRLRIHLALPE